ncbi:MAG TPA: DUF2382 domain-containing protein [Allosphingosinicella sp.]|jgi:hypothetical protein|uniref:DUF2382 domain-containing protein n=1 Tax=Allosphingosinicella sp. TaxID=2823234 RepID=UPI002F285B39
MARRVSAFYRSRALADEAAARLAASGVDAAAISVSEQRDGAEAQAGMFDRLAKMIAPEGAAQDTGYVVSTQVAPERIDSAAMALEVGAERVEIAPPQRLAEHVVELSETAEELVIEKHAVLREEIVMRVQAKEHVQHIHDTLRRTEVEVERFGPSGESGG